MPRLENAGGDRLARGAASHTFRPMGERLSQENWDKMFQEETPQEVKAVYLLKCPVHGTQETTHECFISGGYPLLDEYTKKKCSEEGCDEIASYVGYKKIE